MRLSTKPRLFSHEPNQNVKLKLNNAAPKRVSTLDKTLVLIRHQPSLYELFFSSSFIKTRNKMYFIQAKRPFVKSAENV